MCAVIYARYSSENQRDASIDDQVRVAGAASRRRTGCLLAPTPTTRSAARSACARATRNFSRMPASAASTWSWPRRSTALSRDQEDVAALYKHLTFARVELISVAEGTITELHVGLKGTMNALFLKDLGQKVRRGLESRVREGRSGGGLCVKRRCDRGDAQRRRGLPDVQ